jgi:hypothetical protein
MVVPMTNLVRPVIRRCTLPFLHYRKPLIVTLEPGDVLAMQLEGHPTVRRAPLSQIFIWLCLWSAVSRKAKPGR